LAQKSKWPRCLAAILFPACVRSGRRLLLSSGQGFKLGQRGAGGLSYLIAEPDEKLVQNRAFLIRREARHFVALRHGQLGDLDWLLVRTKNSLSVMLFDDPIHPQQLEVKFTQFDGVENILLSSTV
jgi:hypothetical protein